MKYAMMTIAASAVLLGNAGCSDFRQAFGLDRQSPDEYTVVEHEPLTMPPDFGLRPPRNPSERTIAEPVEQAREAVFRVPSNSTAVQTNGRSPGENALLARAGAASTDEGVRAQVDQETAALDHPNESFVDSLLFWKPAPKAPNEALDAAKEAQRLKADNAEGKPVTADAGGGAGAEAGQPTIERTASKSSSFWDIF